MDFDVQIKGKGIIAYCAPVNVGQAVRCAYGQGKHIGECFALRIWGTGDCGELPSLCLGVAWLQRTAVKTGHQLMNVRLRVRINSENYRRRSSFTTLGHTGPHHCPAADWLRYRSCRGEAFVHLHSLCTTFESEFVSSQ
jgi:hypothetical protein